MEESEYRRLLAKAGFQDITIEPTRIYRAEDAREFLAGMEADVARIAAAVDGTFMSAFVRAERPAA